MPNLDAKQQGVETRNKIVDLVTANVADGGDGMTRLELADVLGIAKPTVRKHIVTLLTEDRRLEETTGHRLVPSEVGHVHVCRTCGHSFDH